MAASATTLRPLVPADLPAAEALARAVGWPHRAQDWGLALDLGFGVVAEREGEVLGTAMGWCFGAEAGAIGMIIVAPTAQGAGLGRVLTQAVLDRLGGRTLHLHATAAGLPLYRKLGFQEAGMVRQHQGIASAVPLPEAALRPATPDDLDAVAALDRAATGLDRAAAMAALLAAGQATLLLRHGVPCGVAMCRRFGRGTLIGPVDAPDAEGARALIAPMLRQGAFTRIDVPEDSGLAPWLEAAGLADAGGAVPMRRGDAPATGAVRRFALISQALG